jgi:hypothetical protein
MPAESISELFPKDFKRKKVFVIEKTEILFF